VVAGVVGESGVGGVVVVVVVDWWDIKLEAVIVDEAVVVAITAAYYLHAASCVYMRPRPCE
jgi:hypothetical protein